eukprot:15332364-Ditylum_brightwellii.AAC.1
MDYLSTYPDGKIRFYAGTMPLCIDSNAAHLVQAPNNGAVHTECRTLRNVVCSATKAECDRLFHNSQMAITIYNMLIDMGHSQELNRIKTDNIIAYLFVHALMRVEHSKFWDMCWHWLRKAATCKSIQIFWDKGTNNDGDYFTKHHVPVHH